MFNDNFQYIYHMFPKVMLKVVLKCTHTVCKFWLKCTQSGQFYDLVKNEKVYVCLRLVFLNVQKTGFWF